MSKHLILLQRTPTKDDIQWIKETYQSTSSIIYNELQKAQVDGLEDYEQKYYQLDESLKRKVNTEVLDVILDFGDSKSDSKFSFAQRFQYQQLNIWYYNKFRIYYSLRDSIYQVKKVEQLVNQFDSIVIFSNTSYLGLLDSYSNVFIKQGQKAKTGKKLKWIFLLKFFLRSIFNPFLKHNPINKFLVISPSERVQPMVNRKDLTKELNDPIFGYLLKKYEKDFIILNEMNVPHPGSVPIDTPWFPNHHRYFILGEAILFKALFSPGIWKEWRIVSNKFKRILEKLSQKKIRREHMAILRLLNDYQTSHKYFIFRYLAYRKYFKKRKIRAIIATDENSMFVKVILDAAREADILTVGAQHGNIHPLHPAYRFTKNDIELHPMPDYTLIWGERWKDVMVEYGNYNEEELAIVGQLRTDIIPKLKENSENRPFTVVFASQPQPDKQLKERAAQDVLMMAMNLGLKLKIKLHPREVDADYYHKIAERIGYSQLEFTVDEDLYEVILNADLIITCYSTVGAESAYFHKSLIILDYLEEDINGYAKDGIAFQASDYDKLLSLCKEISSNRLQIERAVQDDYIQDCAFKIDGRVSTRIIEWLRDLHPITSHNVV